LNRTSPRIWIGCGEEKMREDKIEYLLTRLRDAAYANYTGELISPALFCLVERELTQCCIEWGFPDYRVECNRNMNIDEVININTLVFRVIMPEIDYLIAVVPQGVF